MSEPTATVLKHVKRERDRQEELKRKGKFAFTCADPEMSNPERFLVLAEEFGEVGHELNEAIGGRALDVAKLRTELVQVAAVCVAWCEALDAEARV
jgi:NTP pyrophosphatase (non-canonical NTP hydrolase)